MVSSSSGGRRAAGPRLPALQVIEAPVHRQAIEPGPHRGVAAKFRKLSIGQQKDLLEQVLRVGAGPAHPPREVEQPRRMLLIELLESWDISFGHSASLDEPGPPGVAGRVHPCRSCDAAARQAGDSTTMRPRLMRGYLPAHQDHRHHRSGHREPGEARQAHPGRAGCDAPEHGARDRRLGDLAGEAYSRGLGRGQAACRGDDGREGTRDPHRRGRRADRLQGGGAVRALHDRSARRVGHRRQLSRACRTTSRWCDGAARQRAHPHGGAGQGQTPPCAVA